MVASDVNSSCRSTSGKWAYTGRSYEPTQCSFPQTAMYQGPPSPASQLQATSTVVAPDRYLCYQRPLSSREPVEHCMYGVVVALIASWWPPLKSTLAGPCQAVRDHPVSRRLASKKTPASARRHWSENASKCISHVAGTDWQLGNLKTALHDGRYPLIIGQGFYYHLHFIPVPPVFSR